MQEFDLDSRLVGLPDADDSFPRVSSLLDDAPNVRLLLEVAPEMFWFEGHFPGRPILPGVIQLHWAVIVTRALFGFSDMPREIKRLKFKKIVMPPQQLELLIGKRGSHEVQFEYCCLGEQNSQGRLVFAESTT